MSSDVNGRYVGFAYANEKTIDQHNSVKKMMMKFFIFKPSLDKRILMELFNSHQTHMHGRFQTHRKWNLCLNLIFVLKNWMQILCIFATITCIVCVGCKQTQWNTKNETTMRKPKCNQLKEKIKLMCFYTTGCWKDITVILGNSAMCD